MAGLAARYPATNQDKGGGVEPYFPAGARLRSQVSLEISETLVQADDDVAAFSE